MPKLNDSELGCIKSWWQIKKKKIDPSPVGKWMSVYCFTSGQKTQVSYAESLVPFQIQIPFYFCSCSLISGIHASFPVLSALLSLVYSFRFNQSGAWVCSWDVWHYFQHFMIKNTSLKKMQIKFYDYVGC